MNGIRIKERKSTEKGLQAVNNELSRHLQAFSGDVCPVEYMAAALRLSQAQSCGKCVPCRVGLGNLADKMDSILAGEAVEEDLKLIAKTCHTIALTADCAIGREAALLLENNLKAFEEDFLSHIKYGKCSAQFKSVPCVYGCPANVDIPGYIALTQAERYKDAVRLIRKDNPFVAACALICEHPCETRCRRGLVDTAVNIRGLKRFALEQAGIVEAPAKLAPTGKKIAVIGAGPSGLTAAYYLSLMGHEVTIYEKRKRLGGMLRYGIPNYRLPDNYLDQDIDNILSTGVVVKTEVTIGEDITLDKLKKDYDSIYIAIGAHTDKKLGIANEDKKGVMSAVELLRHIGDGGSFDFGGKNVVIVGGGNVAMDATRTAKRLGAASVTCVYRRRIEDMTALPEEVEGAKAEGCEIMTLMAPNRIEIDEQENVVGLVVDPQIIGEVKRGRPSPRKADKAEVLLPADIIIVAIGQDIESDPFKAAGLAVDRACLKASNDTKAIGQEGIFVGGDCQSGPATVIKAIEAGKVAAANIDHYLGCDSILDLGVEIPHAPAKYTKPSGRVNMTEKAAEDRKNNFALMENSLTYEEAMQETNRCLRCDHYGKGSFCGGRKVQW